MAFPLYIVNVWFHWSITEHCYQTQHQRVENAGVAFVKGANERNELFEKISKQ